MRYALCGARREEWHGEWWLLARAGEADARLLSSARLTPPQYGRTLLHVAAVGNRLALARLLLDRGANPAATDVVRPPLLRAPTQTLPHRPGTPTRSLGLLPV